MADSNKRDLIASVWNGTVIVGDELGDVWHFYREQSHPAQPWCVIKVATGLKQRQT